MSSKELFIRELESAKEIIDEIILLTREPPNIDYDWDKSDKNNQLSLLTLVFKKIDHIRLIAVCK